MNIQAERSSKVQQCSVSVFDDFNQTDGIQARISNAYEFTPSGTKTQNNMMIVLPLLPQHCYDYENLKLMYRKDANSEFVLADSLQENKPRWMFARDRCYVLTNHFCGYLVKTDKCEGKNMKSLTLEAILLSKYDEGTLRLKLTFGCYDGQARCSKAAVIKVIRCLAIAALFCHQLNCMKFKETSYHKVNICFNNSHY